MKFARILTLILSLVLASSASLGATAQTDPLLEKLESAEEVFGQIWTDTTFQAGTPVVDTMPVTPILTNAVAVFTTEAEAVEAYELYANASIEEGVEPVNIDNLGDGAASFTVDEEWPDHIAIAHQDNVFIMSIALDWPNGEELPERVIRHILETGPSNNDVIIDKETGFATGGWADSFPQPEDIEELSELEPLPVMGLFGSGVEIPQVPVATPEIEESPASTPIDHTMITQNYIDFSDEAMESATMPEIIMITVQIFDSEADAELAFQAWSERDSFDTGMDITEIDDLGDEALFIEQVDEAGDHGASTIARSGDTLIIAFVTGAPDAPELSQDIAHHMVEAGPSAEPFVEAADGSVTGGWAEAFPAPEEIEGISHLDPQPVQVFED